MKHLPPLPRRPSLASSLARSRSLLGPGLGLLALLPGCSLLFGGPTPMTEGAGFFDRPWPSDDRLIDGHPDLSDFPQAADNELVKRYVGEAARLDGFGTNAPLYVRFDGPLDTERLPGWRRSAELGSPIYLLDIDRQSPHRGELVPWTWAWQAEATTWQPENLLAIQPVWGLPLRPHNRYALVLTTDLARPVAGFDDVWREDDPRHADYQDLHETLFSLHVSTDTVALATVFTTQDPTAEMGRLARAVKALPVPDLSQELVPFNENGVFKAFSGSLDIPIWTHGESPYTAEGGQFEFDADGEPILAGWEHCQFVFSVPTDPDSVPADGWPVVIQGHGTGGDAGSHFESDDPLEIAGQLARGGMAAFGIALPFHGDRWKGGDPAILSFNYLNPTSGRTSFREAALEQLYLAHVLHGQPHHFWAEPARANDSELDARTNPEKIAYLGHSHGGEIGILAAPFFGDDARAVVLSGAGGGLSLSVVKRDAGDIDIQAILRSALHFQDDESLTETHPVVGLVQTVAEATDPLNYATYWHHRAPEWEGTPAHVLMFEGLQDIYTPPVAIEVLAGAAHHPILAPAFAEATVQAAQELDTVETPVELNLRAWNNAYVTGGLAQFPDDGHFAIFDNIEAAHLYRDFLQSAMEGFPVIGPEDEGSTEDGASP